MVDLVNQGKGNILEIWGTNDEFILNEIYSFCLKSGLDFWKPEQHIRERILQMIKETGKVQ